MQTTLLTRDLVTSIDSDKEDNIQIIGTEIKFHDFIVSDPSYTVDTSDDRRRILQQENALDIQYFTIKDLSYPNRDKVAIYKPFYTALQFDMYNKKVSRLGILKEEYVNPGYLEVITNAFWRQDEGFNEIEFFDEVESMIGRRLSEYEDDYYIELEKVGEVGVDSAYAGFFDYEMFEDPDMRKRINPSLTKDNYFEEYPQIIVTDEFCISSSGFGDGLYDLYKIQIRQRMYVEGPDDTLNYAGYSNLIETIGYVIDYKIYETKSLLDQAENVTETYEIYFDDLDENVQDKIIEFLGEEPSPDFRIAKIVKNIKTGDKFIANFNTIKEEE